MKGSEKQIIWAKKIIAAKIEELKKSIQVRKQPKLALPNSEDSLSRNAKIIAENELAISILENATCASEIIDFRTSRPIDLAVSISLRAGDNRLQKLIWESRGL